MGVDRSGGGGEDMRHLIECDDLGTHRFRDELMRAGLNDLQCFRVSGGNIIASPFYHHNEFHFF